MNALTSEQMGDREVFGIAAEKFLWR